MSLSLADHPSRGVLPSVVVKPGCWESPGPLKVVAPWGKNNVRILHDSPFHSASVRNLFCFISVGKLHTRPVQDLLVSPPSVHNYPPATRLIDQDNTAMRRLTTGIHSEKCFFRRFRRCANIIECIYIKLDSTAYYTHSLYGIAYCSYSTNL